MDPRDLGPTDEAKGKDGGHSLSLLPPRFLSEHQLQYTSWQNTARAMLAAPEAGKRRMAGREGKKIRHSFGEKRWAQEMVLVDTLPAVKSQRERAKFRRNVQVSLQLSHPGHALGRCCEHDTDSVTQGSLPSARTWKEPPKEGYLEVQAELRGRGCHRLLCKKQGKDSKQFSHTWTARSVGSHHT